MGDDGRACAIEAFEPCQMGNQAAIRNVFDVLRSTRPEPTIMLLERLYWAFFGKGEKQNGISGYIQEMAS